MEDTNGTTAVKTRRILNPMKRIKQMVEQITMVVEHAKIDVLKMMDELPTVEATAKPGVPTASMSIMVLVNAKK
jgi:hypothetical protein